MDASRYPPVVRRLFAAMAVTYTGDAVTLVALPLTAVLVLDASPGELALVGAAQAVPIVAFSLPLGAWVDRGRRRWPLLVAADLVRAALLACVPLAAVAGVLSLPMLAAIAFLVSTASTLFDLAFSGWLPRLLGGDELHRANARVELARSAAQVAGPATGGALVSVLSAPMALLADAVSFVASAAIIGSIRRAEPAFAAPRERRSLGAELVAGAAFIARQRFVAAIVATVTTNNLSRSVAMGVAIFYLVESAGMGPAAIGLAFAIGNTGFLVGAVAARPLTSRLGMGRTMQLGVSLFGPSMLLFAVVPPGLAGWVFTLMLFAHGFGIAIHNVNQVTVRQLLTPDWLRARVVAVTRLAGGGAIPLGSVLGGVIAEVAGVRWALVAGGVGLAAGSLPYLLAGVRRLLTVGDVTAVAEADPVARAA
jgi:MFS family permease